MAAPAHYIRTIHSSFTAAHPHSSSAASAAAAWAASSASSQYLNQFSHTHNTTPANIVAQPRHHHGYTSISTHNTHMYTHHLRDLTHSPAAAAHHHHRPASPGAIPVQHQSPYVPHGPRKAPMSSTADTPRSRRRSVSIRMPPTYKFDPFADEPAAAPEVQTVSQLAEMDAPNHHTHTPSAPYTIQIPAAAQTDIQLYTPTPPPRSRSASPPPTHTPTPAISTPRALSPRAPSFTPKQAQAQSQAYTGPARPQAPRAAPPNLSKVVASILLNRVHAVGKPMRRRVMPSPVGRDYVKSCLSSVVSIEA